MTKWHLSWLELFAIEYREVVICNGQQKHRVGMTPDKNGQPSTKSSLKTTILEHFEAVTYVDLDNKTDQPPQNAKVVRFCLGKMKRQICASLNQMIAY